VSPLRRPIDECELLKMFRRRHGALLAALVVGVGVIAPSRAQVPGPPSPIATVDYVAPSNPRHQSIHDKLLAERWLERMQGVVQHFRLPSRIGLKLDNCDGEVEAWFANATITICYEYLAVVMRQIEGRALPPWVTENEALAGAFVDVVLHEFAHALFTAHRIPILGREEDAADQFSVFAMVELGGETAAGLVRGTAHLYLTWMSFYQSRQHSELIGGLRRRDARVHPTAAQRLYNLVCIALGSDPQAYAALAKSIDMPPDRAADCDAEFGQVERAWAKLVKPHIDKTREAEAKRQLQQFIAPK
jgi:Putative metallopeptidase